MAEQVGVDRAVGRDLEDVAAERHPAQRLRRVERDELPVEDQGDLVAVLGLRDVLGRDDQRPSLRPQAAQLVPDGLAQDRVDAGGRLVDEEHFGVVDERARELEAALHAAGEVAGEDVARVEEVDDLERALDSTGAPEGTDAVQRRNESDVLLCRQVLVEAEQLGHVGEPAAHSAAEAHRVLAQDGDLALASAERAGEHPDRRRLAGSARADDAEDRPRVDLERQVVDDDAPVEGAGHVARRR